VNRIFEAAVDIQGACLSRGWRFCIIGAVAVQRWGEPRLTRDVDLTVLSGFGSEAEYVDALLAAYRPRIDDAREFALRHRVVLIQTAAGVPVDVALGAMPFEERAVARASPFAVGEGHSILTCSAEDLVVFKAFAGRDQDWLDIAGIVARQGPDLDAALVLDEAGPLLELKEAPAALERLRRLLGERTG
jgi:hypothetical protein